MQFSHRVAVPQHLQGSNRDKSLQLAGNDVDRAIGLKLAHDRRRRGLTQAEVAGGAGVTEADVADYERGMKRPAPQTLARMAEILGSSIESLFQFVRL